MVDYLNIAGVMSGTSLDGIDIVVVRFDLKNFKNFNILFAKTFPIYEALKQNIRNFLNLPLKKALETDRDFALLIAKYLCKVKKQLDFQLIASHGHTVVHFPEQKLNLQIGKGTYIAAECKIPVIYDFRSLDIALGGQGAPLVPVGEKYLFPDFKAFLNLGGFANFTFINKKITAFDVTVCNFALNFYARKLGLEYDKDGLAAQKGKILKQKLFFLNNLEFYKQNFKQKSLSDHWFYEKIKPVFDDTENIYDILRTLYEHIAEQIAKVFQYFDSQEIMITGGGVKNKFLISLIRQKTSKKIFIPDNTIIDFKEALIFAFLGLLAYLKKNNVFSSVTGSKSANIGGILVYPFENQ